MGGWPPFTGLHDPRFGRDVALKVLPHAFMHDPSFRVSFEREARTIAALEHPAIVPVYDFGEHEGQPYLVMRLMAGGSLADRLAQGPLSLTETGNILRRISEALEKAHARASSTAISSLATFFLTRITTPICLTSVLPN